MNKEEYIKIREEEAIPLSLFYEYYIEKCVDNRLVKTLEEFEEYFPQFMANFARQAIITQNGIKFIDFTSITEKIYKHFNEKYGKEI